VSRESPADLRAAIAANASAADVALLAAVPAILVGVFLLPEATREAFVLDYRAPTAVDAYASHFVHFEVTHLAGNLAAYALAVVPAYGYCVAAGRRSDFFAVFGAVLAVFPYALSGLNVGFARSSVGFGFSGLSMAFLGFLPVALALYARERLLPGVTLDHAPLLFFAGVGVVAVLSVPAAPASSLPLVAVALAAVGVATYGWSLWTSVDRTSLTTAAGRAGDVEFAAAGVALVLAAPFVAFPTQPAGSGGSVLNVYTHLLGFCLGFVVPYATLRLTDELA